MQIIIELPEDIANEIQPANVSHQVLQLIAADNYCQSYIAIRFS